MSDMQAMAEQAVARILEQREEILAAFIAKYGFEPDEAVQVIQMTPEGTRWWVQRRPKEEEKQ